MSASSPNAGPVGDLGLDPLLRALKFVAFDFDGVFTDNSVIVDESGRESVRCTRADGIGLERLRALGLPAAIISTEVNEVVARRAAKLRIDCHHGIADKLARLEQLLVQQGARLADAAFVGNDINDRDCLAAVGLPIVVADAHPDVRGLARYVTRRPGGYGAVREVCDMIAAARAGGA